jgi:hypothetical protein
VSRADLGASCTCPSRKQPCKHSLGLLLLAADSLADLPEGEPPAWVAQWLARRAGSTERRPARTSSTNGAAAGAQQAKRAAQRMARVHQGLAALDLWLCDLIRNGLAELEAKPATFWEQQAARLVDAQAPGLAARVRRMAAIPGSSPDWPERLLARLGRLALLIEAFARLDALDPALQDEARGLIGWTLKEDEVIARGETLRDHWAVLGQRVEDDDQLHTQRTWLRGMRGGRHALVLQFAHGGASFPTLLAPGTRMEADLTFWPGAYPLRALIRARHGEPSRLRCRLPGASSVDAFCADVAAALARQPWLDRFPCLLNDVVPIPSGYVHPTLAAGGNPPLSAASGPVPPRARTGSWQKRVANLWTVRDSSGAVLPLARGDHWTLLALSGGAPLDLMGEWDGESLLPLGAIVDDSYYPLSEVPL